MSLISDRPASVLSGQTFAALGTSTRWRGCRRENGVLFDLDQFVPWLAQMVLSRFLLMSRLLQYATYWNRPFAKPLLPRVIVQAEKLV
ncbi:hypothetical protein [Bradyrhizobium sp. CCBAU 53421]|uniref:hypothetical protein n=1 Tax=Bradyrhizobium sp. CCBAU 53421 TaxID=1325120 RepID=UPI00188BB498|nr:hypothetical protein [Bradyrhizobium sp. CCBAU 53421]